MLPSPCICPSVGPLAPPGLTSGQVDGDSMLILQIGRGVGLRGGKSPPGSNLGHLRQPIWASHVGGRNPKAYRIRCQIRQGDYRWGGGFLVEKHTLTCTHVDTHVRAPQPARLGQPPHHFLDCMETVELVNSQIMPMAFCVPCI